MGRWWQAALVVTGIGIPVGAVAIPGLLSSRRASNERMASSMLKVLTGVEADFRANDRDENGVHDFWTGDVSGLYSLKVRGKELSLIGRSMAEADTGPIHGLCWPYRPREGYFYAVLEADDSVEGPEGIYFQDTGGNRPMGEVHNLTKFGFCSYPESAASGKYSFVVNENNTILRRETIQRVTRWPSDTQLIAAWGG